MSAASYESITIVGMDASRTRKDETSVLHHVHLNLSKKPSAAWSQDFDRAWMEHIYGMKRRAQVSGGGIVIVCRLEELETDHKAELDKIVAEVNERQRMAADQAHAAKKNEEDAALEERKRVEEAARRFNKGA